MMRDYKSLYSNAVRLQIRLNGKGYAIEARNLEPYVKEQ